MSIDKVVANYRAKLAEDLEYMLLQGFISSNMSVKALIIFLRKSVQ